MINVKSGSRRATHRSFVGERRREAIDEDVEQRRQDLTQQARRVGNDDLPHVHGVLTDARGAVGSADVHAGEHVVTTFFSESDGDLLCV